MTAARLSRTGRTEHPWFVSSIPLNLFSVEELLHFLYHNPELIDEEIRSAALARWLVTECKLTDTALRMERGLGKGRSLKDFILPLFRDTAYLSSGDLLRYTRELDLLETASYPERLRRKADALVRNARYGEAVSNYHMAEESAPKEDRGLLAAIFKGRGIALMRLLAWDEGCAAFEKSMRMVQSGNTLRLLLTAYRIAKPEEVFRLRAEELEASSDLLEEIDREIAAARAEVTETEVTDSLLLALREQYHKEAGT